MNRYDVIGFLTDYGLADGFVAACHGVLARLAPQARVIDITHLVPAADVRRGAAVLAETVPWLQPAVVVAVVDPGVGTSRRAVAVRSGQSVLVGPDNGLLCWAWDVLGGADEATEILPADPEAAVSATFHGRDVFAPAAGRLAAGTPLAELGPGLDPTSLSRLADPHVRATDSGLEAEVLTVDRFGNLALAARPADLTRTGREGRPASVVLVHGERRWRMPVVTTFADVADGALLAFVDSAGRLAVAVNGGDAATALGVAAGAVVTLEPAQNGTLRRSP